MRHTIPGDPRISTICCLLALLILGNGTASQATPPSAGSLTVAVVSPRCAFGDVEANLNHFTTFVEDARAKGARLVCFPELALTAYSTDAAILRSAEEIPGPTTTKLESVARRLDVYISVGMAEREGQHHYIAHVLVGPQGYLGKYRKHHPTGPEQACGFSPGQPFPTWDIDGFRFGILICFDGRHQDTIEAMKNAHVDVIHHPHGNTVGNLGREAEEWTRSKMVYFVPRAVQARAHILVNNSSEDTPQPQATLQYSSGALVIDALGQVVGRTTQRDRKEKMIITTLQKPEAIIPAGELRQLQADPVFKARFAAQEVPDVIFSTPYVTGRPKTAEFDYNGQAIGAGREAFAAIVERIHKLPAGTSVVWGPDYSRCGSCSGAEPACVPKFLYPDLWGELEVIVRDRRLFLSSNFPGPHLRPVGPKAVEKADRVAIEWTNFHGPQTPHEEVLYLVNGQFIGRGDEGFSRVLARLRQLPENAAVVLPQYENRGRWVAEALDGEEIKARNVTLRRLVPFANRREEFDAAIKERGLQLSYFPASSPGRDPRTIMDWDSGDRHGSAFVSFGRIVRYDEQPRAAAARLAWTGYDASNRHAPDQKRAMETDARYTLNDGEAGQGVAGFAKAMDRLAALPPGSTVNVRVCLRTKGPFLCPIIYEGHRHFERTGFEPYAGMFPWLIDIARKGELDVRWIPDEQQSCGNCELNR